MFDTIPTDEERHAAIARPMREQTAIDEAMIEQLVRGGAGDLFSEPISEYFVERA